MVNRDTRKRNGICWEDKAAGRLLGFREVCCSSLGDKKILWFK